MTQTNRPCGKGGIKLDSDGLGPSQRALALEREKIKKQPPPPSTKPKVIYQLFYQKKNRTNLFIQPLLEMLKVIYKV